jgi:hypothetical protein
VLLHLLEERRDRTRRFAVRADRAQLDAPAVLLPGGLRVWTADWMSGEELWIEMDAARGEKIVPYPLPGDPYPLTYLEFVDLGLPRAAVRVVHDVLVRHIQGDLEVAEDGEALRLSSGAVVVPAVQEARVDARAESRWGVARRGLRSCAFDWCDLYVCSARRGGVAATHSDSAQDLVNSLVETFSPLITSHLGPESTPSSSGHVS